MALTPKKIIVCETIIKEMLPLLPPDVEYQTVESGLHLRPEKLRAALQTFIDESDTQTIILGYGLCSMAVVGLKSDHSTLVVPRLDDCIALFLGSQKRYREQLSKEPGTYYLSKGWIDAGVNLIEEFKIMEERYGKKRADMVKKRMLQHYTRLAFIDMGYRDQEHYREFSRRAADELDLYYEEIKGTERMLKKMIHGPWDHDFVVAPPGHTISLDDFGMTPAQTISTPGGSFKME
jgi:Protein of unknown function (DUF1638)